MIKRTESPLRFLMVNQTRELIRRGHEMIVKVDDKYISYHCVADMLDTYGFCNRFDKPEISLDEQWEELTGFKLDKFEQYYERLNGSPRRCKYCGNTHLKVTPGYIGEDVVSCPDCQRILWTQEVTESMLR